MLREMGVYGGAQGIWVDKRRTGALTADGNGVTVGVRHTGQHYQKHRILPADKQARDQRAPRHGSRTSS